MAISHTCMPSHLFASFAFLMFSVFFLSRKNERAYILQSVHNFLRLFNVLPNFPFTASETMGNYYL